MFLNYSNMMNFVKLCFNFIFNIHMYIHKNIYIYTLLLSMHKNITFFTLVERRFLLFSNVGNLKLTFS